MTSINAPTKAKKKFSEYLPIWLKDIHSLFYYFLLLLGLGVLFFAVSLFSNYFTTPFTGDYSAQQIAFYTNGYDDWWHFIKTGEFVFYDTNTFLGANNIGSNSFYYLFDPFFLPILLFPRQGIAQGMAILTIFKIAGAGMTFYMYMRYMGASRTSAKLSGIAYAFSGWTAWYLWFNHFTEITIVFPLMLLGVEKILKEKKPWILMASIALMGFTNYFFCICFTLCAFIYAMFRFFQRIKLNNWKNNLLFLLIGFVGFLAGLLMACMSIIPSATVALTSSRAETSIYLTELKEALTNVDLKSLFKLMTSWKGLASESYAQRDQARPFYFLIELMYPVTSDRGVPLVEYQNNYGSYDNVAGSLFCFTPFILLFTPAFIKAIREKHYSVIPGTILFVLAILSPFFYYLFFGFTQPYSRWFLFPIASTITFVGLYLDKFKDDDIWTLDVGIGVSLLLAILGGIFSYQIVHKYGSGTNDYFTERVPILLVTIIMCVYLSGLYLILRFLKKKPKMHIIFYSFLTFEITAMGAFIYAGHGVNNYYYVNEGLNNNNALHSLVEQSRKKDGEYYRSYSSLAGSSANNDGMRNNYNGASFFHSLYNYNTDGIKNGTYISTGSWSGTYLEKRIGLDTLLGVKYYYIQDDYFSYYGEQRKQTAREDFRYNAPFGFIDVTDEYKTSNIAPFKIYKNENNINFALSYDKAYLAGKLSNTSIINQECLFLNGAQITNSTYNPLGQILLEQHPDISQLKNLYEYQTFKYQAINSYNGDNPYNKYCVTYYDIFSAPNKNGNYTNAISLSVPEMLDVENGGFKASNYPKFPENPTNENYSRYIAVINIPESTDLYNENGMVYYLNNSFDSNRKADFYFVDKDNKVITFDNHSDSHYSSSWHSKNLRAFYIVPNKDGIAPKVRKIVVVSRGNEIENFTSLYFDTYNNYLAALEKFNDNPISNINYRTNHFDFDTNFAKERIIVTRLAYENGFRVQMIDGNGRKQNLETFSADGGLLSFISGTGSCHYELDFYPPGLEYGSLLSAVGGFIFISSFIGYIYVQMCLDKKNNNSLFGFSRQKEKAPWLL